MSKALIAAERCQASKRNPLLLSWGCPQRCWGTSEIWQVGRNCTAQSQLKTSARSQKYRRHREAQQQGASQPSTFQVTRDHDHFNAVFFPAVIWNGLQTHRVANWKSWSCIFQTASTHRNYPITCLPRIIYVMRQSSTSHAFPKSQGRKKNAFADKRMHLLYVDSVKGSKDSKAKCLLSMVLQK